jgi:prophage regulatory protein
MSPTQSLIRLPEVRRLTGLARSTLYRLEKAGLFVPRVRIGQRATAWRLEQVQAWIAARPLACVHTSSEPMDMYTCTPKEACK